MNTPGPASRIRDAYALLIRVASYFQSPLLLILRLYWGLSFFRTGKGKLADLSAPTQFFTDLGIPFPAFNAVLVGCTEMICGLLLIIGLASRLAAFPLIVTLVVAYITADREALTAIFSDPDKFLEATPFLFLLASFIIFAFGPGVFSLDYLIGKKFTSAASAPPRGSQTT